jgi:hypothetical protein
MGAILAKLNGYKVYFLSIGAILTAIGGYLSGALDLNGLVQAVWAALIAMGLRHGITTTVSDATNKKL